MNMKIMAGAIFISGLAGAVCFFNFKPGMAKSQKNAWVDGNATWHPKATSVAGHTVQQPNTMLGAGFESTEPIMLGNAVPDKDSSDANPIQGGKNPWGGNVVLAPVGSGVRAFDSSYYTLLESLWSPVSGRLFDRAAEVLQMPDEERKTISKELGKLQQNYAKHIAANGVLAAETDMKATFLVAPFDEKAETANQDFLKSVQAQVSERTYNIILDGMPAFVKVMGYNGEPMEIIIMKDARKENVFRVDMNNAVDKNTSAGGVRNLYPVSKNDLIRLYGQLINNANSNILK